jgi:uncharacterized protein YwlG (UPF0340 family)
LEVKYKSRIQKIGGSYYMYLPPELKDIVEVENLEGDIVIDIKDKIITGIIFKTRNM